jgi:hypothetical protein
LCGTDTGTLRKIDKIYLGILEIRCGRRVEEIVGNYSVKNYVLYRVKKKDNILNTIKEKEPNGFVTSCAGTAFKDTLLKEK